MLCFLSTLEGVFLGGLLVLSFIVIALKNRNDTLRAQAKGLSPLDRHTQDRILFVEPAASKTTKPNPLDWLPTPELVTVHVERIRERVTQNGKIIDTDNLTCSSLWGLIKPHVMPVLFALSIVSVWFGFAYWYDNLNHYLPPAGEVVGDFRILYLKKTIGALLPLISAVGMTLGLLFMIHPRYYLYLNGWTSTDYDFFTDLQRLDELPRFRRVLVFGLLFGLLLLASLYVLLHSSPQELTL